MPDVAATPQLPHGMMGLQPQAFPWMTALGLALGLMALGLIGWFLWQRWRRKSRLPRAPVTAAPQDPWARLDASLNQLDIQEPWTREACEAYFYRLSFALREALELRTGLPITGQTLAETKKSLEKNPLLSANFQEDLLRFLSRAEQLKFAGQWLQAAESLEWRDKVKAWIDQLRRGALS